MLTLPKIAYQNDSRRHEFTATYVPEFEIFRKNTDQNAWNHSATAAFTYFLSRTARFSLSDGYEGSQDPVRSLQNVALLLPRSSYRSNSIGAAFDMEVSPVTAFAVNYYNTITTFGQTDPLQARILDTVGNGASFTVRRMLRRNHRLSAIYSNFKIKPINRARTNDDRVDTKYSFERPIHSVQLQYKIGLSPSSALEFAGGLTRMDTGTAYSFRVAGDRRFGNFFLGAGYSRELFMSAFSGMLPNGLAGAGFFDVFTVHLKGQPTRNVGLLLDTTAAHDASGRIVGTSKSLLGRVRVDYRWTDRTVTFASAETYQQNVNDYVRTPLSRNRFLVGIEFSLSGETERRVNRLNQDEQYVAVSEHARRRPVTQ